VRFKKKLSTKKPKKQQNTETKIHTTEKTSKAQ